jgi:hypothetical protein
VVLGFVLAVLWMSVLVRRTREQREYTAWPKAAPAVSPQTNSGIISTNVIKGQ